MLQGVDINQIKQYNASLKQYKDRAAALKAEIEYTNKEIDNLCAELTTELGVTVTRDNVEQIYNEQVEKINSTLQSGTAVLAKIASEEQNSTPVQPAQPVQNMQTAQPTMSAPQYTNPVPQPSAPVQPTQPVPPVQNNAMPNTVFNGQETPFPSQPLFQLG